MAKGARVRRFAIGDTVYAYEFGNSRGGFYAQFAVADAEHVSPVPKGLDARAAGAAAVTGLTAMQGIEKLVKRLGAKKVIDARNLESIEQLREFAPDGLDRVLALAGGKALERCLEFVHPQGRVVYPNGIEPEPIARRTFRIGAFDAVASPREFGKLQRRIDSGKIRVPITTVYSLARAADAHRHLDRGHVLGRMVFGVRR